VLTGSGPLSVPENRRKAVAEMKRGDDERRVETLARARQLGLPLRGSYPNGGGWALMGFKGEQPIYFTTLNANAAISTGANMLWAAPYGVDGSGGTVGVWDASSARTTHQEFGGRVTSMDGAAATYDHSTHVVGTVCAAGLDLTAKGMAPAVRVDSYDWNSDTAEMAARGASYPGEPGKMNISSHSYGISEGWGKTGTPAYTWYGSGTTASGIEDDFGKYDTLARDTDALAYSLPYYLMFWAAGNDRLDNPPTGASVALVPGGTPVSYNPALHPPWDSTYRGGYDTMGHNALAKNVLSISSVKDATNNGVRDVSAAIMNSFPSWGPADDGRIKPDLVANGYYVNSTSYASDTAYITLYGTSMASPNAAGTAQLLIHYFGLLFTNQTLRASTLKALLIHTADDRGNAGPDYVYGWGLVNATAAADLLRSYRTNAGTRRIIEGRVATNRTSVTYRFTWDGTNPIRATLCWTDPAGEATDEHDSRVARLVNNLDLRVFAPTGAVYEPWVMPFVGDWSTNSLALPATTGSNLTDNVEQVLVTSPGATGTYTACVTFGGSLANGSQPFSLILSGVEGSDMAAAPRLTGSTPANGYGDQLITLTGEGLLLGAEVRLTRSGCSDVPGTGVEVLGDTAKVRIAAAGLATGWWDVTFTNPDGQAAVLTNAFGVGVASKATVLTVY